MSESTSAPTRSRREERVLELIETARSKRPRFRDEHITLAHGAGGKATQTLIEGLLVPAFGGTGLEQLGDAGLIPAAADAPAGAPRLVMTSDSFVVSPLRFPGGSIGELAVNGTVNDLAMAGARASALTVSMILEEGLPSQTLRAEVKAIAAAAQSAGVEIVGGDTKVVQRGLADGMYLCTTGVGVVDRRATVAPQLLKPGDRILVSGPIGEHGTAIMLARGQFDLDADVESDTCCLWPAVDALLGAAGGELHCLRDATRGGVASVMNELARASRVGVLVREADVPIHPVVAAAAELLGIDPMYIANEGRLVAFVSPEAEEDALAALRGTPGCEQAAVIGEVTVEPPGMVLVATAFGGRRVMDQLVGDPLPPDLLTHPRVTQREDTMATPTEFIPNQAATEAVTAHVLWITAGQSCEGDSVAMTSATNPSLEDIIQGVIPGMPRVVVHNGVVAFENGQEFIQAWFDAEQGKLDPFVLVVEGSLGNEQVSGEGFWTGFGIDPRTDQPITVNEWIDRLAPKAAAVVAVGTCATYGGIPAMKNNPTGAMGVPDYLGWKWRSKANLPVICIPGCPAQPDNMTEVLMYLVFHLAGLAPAPELDEQLRPKWLFGRTVREGCNRAGFVEEGQFATEYGSDHRCLVKLGCKGPVVKCNVPVRGWVNGVGGCPNVGGICMACTMPGFPDKYMPFMEPDVWGARAADLERFSYGPIFKFFRERNIKTKYDIEPEWRRRGPALTTGYQKRW